MLQVLQTSFKTMPIMAKLTSVLMFSISLGVLIWLLYLIWGRSWSYHSYYTGVNPVALFVLLIIFVLTAMTGTGFIFHLKWIGLIIPASVYVFTFFISIILLIHKYTSSGKSFSGIIKENAGIVLLFVFVSFLSVLLMLSKSYFKIR